MPPSSWASLSLRNRRTQQKKNKQHATQTRTITPTPIEATWTSFMPLTTPNAGSSGVAWRSAGVVSGSGSDAMLVVLLSDVPIVDPIVEVVLVAVCVSPDGNTVVMPATSRLPVVTVLISGTDARVVTMFDPRSVEAATAEADASTGCPSGMVTSASTLTEPCETITDTNEGSTPAAAAISFRHESITDCITSGISRSRV
mmetsp:Transcript_71181/g.206468  ORF Transcript_71181/g.206468 Transcript_71181/m.206468 type:complete len:200 (-) Transcript_71181:1815-2414(-)